MGEIDVLNFENLCLNKFVCKKIKMRLFLF